MDEIPQAGKTMKITAFLTDADWDEKLNGGKLCLYHKQAAGTDSMQGEQASLITPAADTLVAFDSRLEHEVLPSFADRYVVSCLHIDANRGGGDDLGCYIALPSTQTHLSSHATCMLSQAAVTCDL